MGGIRGVVLGVVLLAGLATGAHALPPEEAIFPADQYKSEAARTLATAHAAHLRRVYDTIYHCLPWLDIGKHGLGFRKPRGVPGDGLYLSVWVWVEQVTTPEFAAMPPARRASAMFSRYGLELLRRLSSDNRISTEPRLDGYAVVLSWLKPDGAVTRGAQPVAETLAVSVDKATLHGFLGLTVTAAEFASRAAVSAFDGKSELGRLALEIWEDSFTKTFKLKDYTPDPAHRC